MAYEMQMSVGVNNPATSTTRNVPFPARGFIMWAQWTMRLTVVTPGAATFAFTWQLLKQAASIAFSNDTTNQIILLADCLQVQAFAATDPIQNCTKNGFAYGLRIPISGRNDTWIATEASTNMTGQVLLQLGLAIL